MLWQLSPGVSKRKIQHNWVPLGTPTLLVTAHPPVMADTLILAGYPLGRPLQPPVPGTQASSPALKRSRLQPRGFQVANPMAEPKSYYRPAQHLPSPIARSLAGRLAIRQACSLKQPFPAPYCRVQCYTMCITILPVRHTAYHQTMVRSPHSGDRPDQPFTAGWIRRSMHSCTRHRQPDQVFSSTARSSNNDRCPGRY